MAGSKQESELWLLAMSLKTCTNVALSSILETESRSASVCCNVVPRWHGSSHQSTLTKINVGADWCAVTLHTDRGDWETGHCSTSSLLASLPQMRRTKTYQVGGRSAQATHTTVVA